MKSELMTQVLRFGAVGAVGFVVDGGLLWLFLSMNLDPYLARALSFPVAVVATWALNRRWTFGATRHAHPKRHFERYFGVQLFGTLSNYTVYSLILGFFGKADLTVFIAFCVGSFAGSVLNFCGARYIAFRVQEQ